MYLDNGGIFVCKTRHLQLAGGAKVSGAISSASYSKMFLITETSTEFIQEEYCHICSSLFVIGTR
jgi:hypothetical protein